MDLPVLQIEHGDKFGKLTVIRRARKQERGPSYLCGCACGYRLNVRRSHLVTGRRTSCDKCAEAA